MAAQVEIVNQPYLCRMQIRIDGQAPSEYSVLEKYMSMPFLSWCGKILPAISEELNGDSFVLFFESRTEEIEIMRVIAASYPGCRQFSARESVRKTPLTERMRTLNQLIRDNKIITFRREVCSCCFIADGSTMRVAGELSELEIRNQFCQVNPQVISVADYVRRPVSAQIYFLICREENLETCLDKVAPNCAFIILLSNQKGFVEVRDQLYIFRTTDDQLFESVFSCFILGPLADIFGNCLRSIPDSVKEKYRDTFNALSSSVGRVIMKADKTELEVGTSTSIRWESDIPGLTVDDSELIFRFSVPGILSCNGMRVTGLKNGTCIMYIYKKGEKDPCFSAKFSVITRNRVTDITFEDKDIIIGQGNSKKLEYSYNPVNADNVNMMAFSSDNPTVASVSSQGILTAHEVGSTTVRLTCERASTYLKINVLPHIQGIRIDENELWMVPGERKKINFSSVPEVCIEGKLKAGCINACVANFANNTLTAVGVGETMLVIQDPAEHHRKEITVHVVTEKDMQKRIRKQAKESSGQKEGLLSKLLRRN